jgi:asparagine synthase (glutamine-hydrolysing)
MGAAWLDRAAVRRVWADFTRGDSDNSFYVWQWVNLGLLSARAAGSLPQAVSA